MSKIILFAFRKSHKKFFYELKKECTSHNVNIVSTKDKIIPSLKGFNSLKYMNFKPAIKFAIDEFYAKTNFKIPKLIIQSFFYIFSYINYFRYYSILNNNYTKMLIWNGGKFRQLIAIEIAKYKNIKVYYFENGLLPNRLVFDENGINFDNSVPRDIKFYKNYTNSLNLPNNIIQRRGKREYKFTGDKVKLPEKFIFVPFQVDYDTQIITNSKWIKNMRMLFSIISQMPNDINFVFKEHPSSGINYPDLHNKIKSYSNIFFANTYSTQELIQNSNAVITINSTVGIESLLFHKKVIVLGDAFYAIDEITYPCKNEIELKNILENINKKELNYNLIDNFLKYLYYDYLIENDDSKYKIMADKLCK